MALGKWWEDSGTEYYYGNAAASSGVDISRTGTEATAIAASFDSGALLPEVIKISVDAYCYEATGGGGSDKRATFAVTVAGSDSRSNAFVPIKTYTFYDPSNGASAGSALVKTFTFDKSSKNFNAAP